MSLRAFIGFDAPTAGAYFAARASIRAQHERQPVTPIVQQLLRMSGIYRRGSDPLASTEFTYTRFLVPHLAGPHGWALFMDSDVLVRADLRQIMKHARHGGAVGVVKHAHRPVETTKMTLAGTPKAQTTYRRKNWSSVMLFNLGHPACQLLTPAVVNEASPAYLHQLEWVDDADIFELPLEWNWLAGWNHLTDCPDPKIVHYTLGVPGIHEGHDDAPFAAEYRRAVAAAIYEREPSYA